MCILDILVIFMYIYISWVFVLSDGKMMIGRFFLFVIGKIYIYSIFLVDEKLDICDNFI